MGFVDYYDVLQVSPRADAEVVGRAYHALISKHHPDKGGDTRHAQRLNEAYDVIGDPDKRAAYNREWARHQPQIDPPRNAESEAVSVPQSEPRRRTQQSESAAGWVVGLVLIFMGVAFVATGSGFVGLLLTVMGMAFIFNLWGLWVLIMLLAIAERKLASVKAREKKLLEGYLDGAVPVELYRESADDLAAQRRALELQLAESGRDAFGAIEQVRELALVASSARVNFQAASECNRREVLSQVLCNLDVEDGDIAFYQWKDPFGLLEMEPSGAFKNEWWAIVEGFVTRRA